MNDKQARFDAAKAEAIENSKKHLAEKKAERESKQASEAEKRKAICEEKAEKKKARCEEKATTDAAVASRLEHAALMRDAERAAADARAAASKAILEFERKMKKADEALSEWVRKSEARDLAHQREEAARTRMDAVDPGVDAQEVDEKTSLDFALAQQQHSQAHLDYWQARLECDTASEVSCTADEEAAMDF